MYESHWTLCHGRLLSCYILCLVTSAESLCLRSRRAWPSSTHWLNFGPRVSISARIPWWYFIRSSTEETSLQWATRNKPHHKEEHGHLYCDDHNDTVSYRGFSCVSICCIMLSIQASRSLTMVKKRNLSAVSSSRFLLPAQASNRPFQASTTSFSVAWIAVAWSPAYWACSLVAVSWNCLTCKEKNMEHPQLFNI